MNTSKKQVFIERLAGALVKLNTMSQQEADSFIKEFKDRARGRVEDFLLDEGLVDRETLLNALQAVYEVPQFDVRGHFFNRQLLLFVPKDFLIDKGIIPLEMDDEIMVVVMSNPEDEDVLETLGNYVSYNVDVMIGIHKDIIDAIEEYYDEDVATADIYDQESNEADEDLKEMETDNVSLDDTKS